MNYIILSILAIILITNSNTLLANSAHENLYKKISSFSSVSLKCVSLKKKSAREVIINNCNECRSVGITRKRSGIPTPVVRRYLVPARSQIFLPFRGPGQTRISNDLACKGNKESQNFKPLKNEGGLESSKSNCISLRQAANGKVILVNSCKLCRGVAIDRLNKIGRSLGRQFLKINPLSIIEIRRFNASRVRLLGEISCER